MSPLSKALRIGFFQVSHDSRNDKITIDLQGTKMNSKIREQIKAALRGSRLVKSYELVEDSQTGDATIVLQCRPSVELEVFELTSQGSKPARLVMDLREIE
jgi:hypothetical protein